MMTVCGKSLGPLALTTVLGRGGMGLVWNAHSPATNRAFAVKMLAPSLVPAKSARARFEREAEILACLDNDGVVKLRDRGETEDGVPFVVMDRIAGRSVDKLLDRKKMLTVRETASILGPLLQTLEGVHRAGVSHRDIKPANIMVHRSASDVSVTLIDFGIAGTQWDAVAVDTHVVGTVHYMSPEQAWSAGRPSPRADLWSVAVVAYECLTGRMPFDGPTLDDVFYALDRGVFLPVSQLRPDLGPEVDDFFARAFHPRLDDRFAGAAAMREALLALPWADQRVPLSCRASCLQCQPVSAPTVDLAIPKPRSSHASGWYKRLGPLEARPPTTRATSRRQRCSTVEDGLQPSFRVASREAGLEQHLETVDSPAELFQMVAGLVRHSLAPLALEQ